MKEYQINNLLEAYKDGTISNEDRFLLEKAALDDPFLFDALEGLSSIQDNEKDPPVTPFISIKWLGYAASIIVLVGATFFFMHSNDGAAIDDNGTIASNNVKKSTEDSEETSSRNTTTSYVEEQSELVTARKQKEVVDYQENEAYNTRKKETIIRKDDVEKTTTDPKSAPVEFVVAHGDDVALEEDLAVETLPVGDIIEEASEDETVVSAESKTRKKVEVFTEGRPTMMNKVDTETDAKRTPLFLNAEPMIGKKDFEEYLQENIKKRGLHQNPSQDIVIEFSLDENGMATDFTHIVVDEKTVCSECGSFAIALFQTSGVWKTYPPNREGRVRYTVRF